MKINTAGRTRARAVERLDPDVAAGSKTRMPVDVVKEKRAAATQLTRGSKKVAKTCQKFRNDGRTTTRQRSGIIIAKIGRTRRLQGVWLCSLTDEKLHFFTFFFKSPKTHQDGLQGHLGSRCFVLQYPLMKSPGHCVGAGTMSSLEILVMASLETLHCVSRVCPVYVRAIGQARES